MSSHAIIIYSFGGNLELGFNKTAAVLIWNTDLEES
jgi:hypothetical protein